MRTRDTPRAGPRLVAIIVACGLFMEQLDGTILSTALPAMARSLQADPLHMSTALTAYLLSLAVFTPVSGQVADRFGSRTVFCAAILLFMAGSALCGLATGLPTLVAARIVQGVGGALMVPVGRLVLLRAVPRQELVSAIAWMLVPGMIGPVLGPPVGGFITSYLNWRWIFYVNIPVGLIGLVAVLRYIEEVKEPGPVRFDIRGTAFSGLSLCCLMFGLETLSRGQIAPEWGTALLATGVVSAVLYWLHSRRHPAPVLDFRLMRIPTFAASVISGTLFRIGFGSLPFLLPMLMQIGFGVSAAESGVITFAAAAGSVLMKATARPMLRILGFRRTFIGVGLVSAVLLASCGLFRPAWPLPLIYAVLLTCGFISSLQFTAYNTIAYADLPARLMSGATSFYSTFQQFALTLGIAVAAASLSVLDKISGQELPDLHDFTVTFLLMGCIAALSVPVAARLPADAGAELSGQRA
jgi:EmrB/QacA subfamily drug resistance transporter